VTTKAIIVAGLLSIAGSLSAQESLPVSTVRVLDAATALRIAEPAFVKAYGKRQIDYEKPLTAVLEDGVWNVYGTSCCPDRKGRRTCGIGKCFGGVAEARVRSRDGRILSISHPK
jgi:NTF2 fold immunity protein